MKNQSEIVVLLKEYTKKHDIVTETANLLGLSESLWNWQKEDTDWENMELLLLKFLLTL